MGKFDTGIAPPSDFKKKLKTYQVRFNLVKKNFEDSYADYMMGVDFGKKNVRNREKWDELYLTMNSEKLSLRGKSDEFNKMVKRLSKSIDKKRNIFYDKSKQDKLNSQILTSAEPLKIQKIYQTIKDLPIDSKQLFTCLNRFCEFHLPPLYAAEAG